MKKILTALALAFAVTGTASAATYVGGSLGYPFSTVHYQSDLAGNSASRFGLNLAPFGGWGFGLGVSADYLKQFSTGSTALNSFDPYFGFGVDAVGYFGGDAGSAFVGYPHALVGAKFNFDPRLSVFGELNAGFWAGTGGIWTGVSGGGRLGINYRLN